MSSLEQISDLHEIADYMKDEELTAALEVVAKLILKPDIPQTAIVPELLKLQAIAMKLSMRATWMANVDKSDRSRKNLYYTAAEQLNLLCQSLKWALK